MKITFIYPRLIRKHLAQDMQPLAFAILAGLTPSDVQVVFYDERFEPIPYWEATDLVALTVETFTAAHSYEIAAQYRKRGIPVVLGGYHPTLVPDEALFHADSIVIGEAETVWPILIEDAKAGRLQKVYRSKRLQDLTGLQPDRRIFKRKPYSRFLPIEFTRGCRYACDFCANHAFRGPGLCHRPVDDVVTEIKVQKSKFFFVVDDNFFSHPQWARELCKALLPLNIHWFCQTSLDLTEDHELLDLMVRSGCFGVLIGFESLNEHNLEQMGKKANLKHKDYSTCIQRFHDAGILIYANFVFGYDQDTPSTFETTYDFALHAKFYLAQFNPLMPVPGTKLYNRLQEEQRLLYQRWWLAPDYRFGQAAFVPRGMTPEELTTGCAQLNRDFYSGSTLLRRIVDPDSWQKNLFSLGIFTIGNLILRQEVYSRLGHPIAVHQA